MTKLVLVGLSVVVLSCQEGDQPKPDMAKPGLGDWNDETGFGGP